MTTYHNITPDNIECVSCGDNDNVRKYTIYYGWKTNVEEEEFNFIIGSVKNKRMYYKIGGQIHENICDECVKALNGRNIKIIGGVFLLIIGSVPFWNSIIQKESLGCLYPFAGTSLIIGIMLLIDAKIFAAKMDLHSADYGGRAVKALHEKDTSYKSDNYGSPVYWTPSEYRKLMEESNKRYLGL